MRNHVEKTEMVGQQCDDAQGWSENISSGIFLTSRFRKSLKVPFVF